MASRRNDTSASEGGGSGGTYTPREGYRELALQLDPELATHPEDMTEAEQRSCLRWRCQIVRIEEGGEIDRALAFYVEGLKRRTGRKTIALAPVIRSLLRQALKQTGNLKRVSRETERAGKTRMKQLGLPGVE